MVHNIYSFPIFPSIVFLSFSTSPFSSETEESEEETNMSSPKHTSLKTEPKQSKSVPKAAQVEESEWDSSDTDFSKEKLGTGKSSSVAAGTHSGDCHLIGFIIVIMYTNVSVKEEEK